MPIYLYRRPSFSRSLRRLGSEQKKIVGAILEALEVYYSSGCNLLAAKEIAPGFFCKQLRKPYCETGVETNLRIVIRREKEKGVVIIAGNHDQIRKFLSS